MPEESGPRSSSASIMGTSIAPSSGSRPGSRRSNPITPHMSGCSDGNGASVALDVGRHVCGYPQIGVLDRRLHYRAHGDYPGPDVEVVVLLLVEREPGAHFGRRLDKREAEEHGAAQLFLRGPAGVGAAPWDDVINHQVEPVILFVQVLHLGRAAQDHH